jgi:hypothetical protein
MILVLPVSGSTDTNESLEFGLGGGGAVFAPT